MNDSLPDFPSDRERQMRKSKQRRAAAVFCLFWYALMGWLRLREALVYWSYLTNLNIWPRPMYILLSGAAIGLSFSLAIVFIFFKARFTSQYIHWLSGIFIAWLWFDHIWLGTREAFNNQVLVMAIISLGTLLVTTLLVRKEDYEEESDHGQQQA